MALNVDEKYKLYEMAVQCPDFDVEFMSEKFQEIHQKAPRVLREDFCGTGYLSCEWVKYHPKNYAYGIDLDWEPISFGLKNHYEKLNAPEKRRMKYVHTNVLKATEYKADVVAALNFSYWVFKKRSDLLRYFQSVRKSLNSKSVFFLDLFGGTDCGKIHVDRVEHKKFTYYWDCESFNPVNNECVYKIHFKMKDKNGKGVRHKNVFTYDWRFWGLPELVDILKEAGFSEVNAYWEGDGDDGSGDGNFQKMESAENCESWVTYLAAIP